jgi:hypothetical protein
MVLAVCLAFLFRRCYFFFVSSADAFGGCVPCLHVVGSWVTQFCRAALSSLSVRPNSIWSGKVSCVPEFVKLLVFDTQSDVHWLRTVSTCVLKVKYDGR